MRVTEAASLTGSPRGGVPVALAVLSRVPASMSAWVTVVVPSHVIVAPAARGLPETGAHVRLSLPTRGSSGVTAVRSTLPVFSTVIV